VRFHGGKVSAFNRPQGGLVIEIRLPMIASEQITAKTIPAATNPAVRDQGPVAKAQ
jgi:hypothetical protein